MNAIENAILRLNKAASPANLKAQLRKVLNENLGEFADANVAQLMAGENAKGIKLGSFKPYQNPLYAAIKNQMNPLPGLDNPDLKQTGDFHESISAKIIGEGIKMHSDDWKAPILMSGKREGYGKSILGIQPERLKVIREEVIKPYLQAAVKKSL